MKKKIGIFCVLFFVLDFLSKIIIDNNLDLAKPIIIIDNFFKITKVYNYGASWSILTGYNVILIIIAILMLIFLYFYEQKFIDNIRNILAFSLLYGGILGNLVNRIFLGYVIDFLDFNIFGYNYPVFNLADIWIVCGTILLAIGIIRKEDDYGNNSK